MGFYATFDSTFARIKTDLEAKSSIKKVVLGEQFRLQDVPMAVINAGETFIEQGALGTSLGCTINFSVIVIVRETSPDDWFAEIVTVMSDVLDAILADRTLGDLVLDTTPTMFSPGELTIEGRLYYGGIVRFQSMLYYTP